MAEAKLNVTVVPAVMVRRGDRVLLTFYTPPWDQAEADQVVAELRKRWPDVDLVAIGGAEAHVVQRDHLQPTRPDREARQADPGETERGGKPPDDWG